MKQIISIKYFPFYFFLLFLLINTLYGQTTKRMVYTPIIKEVELRIDTLSYSYLKDTINYKGRIYLPIVFGNDEEVCEVHIFTNPTLQIESLRLLPSADYDIIDTLLHFNYDYYRTKIRFRNLSKSNFVSLIFGHKKEENTVETFTEIDLMPYSPTVAELYIKDNEIYVGEEKTFELTTNHIDNIVANGLWKKSEQMDYRVTRTGNRLQLHVVPKILGRNSFYFEIQTRKPFLGAHRQPTYTLPVIAQNFEVKSGRLAFLDIAQKDVTLDEDTRKEGIEVRISNHRHLKLNTTYRLEAQEERGGALIAELYTKTLLSNDEVLCLLRAYEYHRRTDGYLFIKAGDEAKFITNISISPRTKIRKLSILRSGAEWTTDNTIYPDETIEVRLEGDALNKGAFKFEGLISLLTDTLIRSENMQNFKLKVPLNITNRRVEIYDHEERTGVSLMVKEYQQPRPFNFIALNYGEGTFPVSGILKPILYDKPIKDINIQLLPNNIEGDTKLLFGKQYISIDVKVTNQRRELLDFRQINKIVVCPGEISPRYESYNNKDCQKTPISLNSIISPKTIDLDEWSKIELTFKHIPENYTTEGYQQKVEIYLERHSIFDVDVSFPAGLLVQRFKKDGFDPLGGVSFAAIAQFKFYQPNRIQRLRPYRVGIGTIAMNAFNLSSTATGRDLGIVALGSVFPTRKETRLSFPLYAGIGYFISAQDWFVMLGPGIRVSL
jgi:hypothetical protein